MIQPIAPMDPGNLVERVDKSLRGQPAPRSKRTTGVEHRTQIGGKETADGRDAEDNASPSDHTATP